MTREEQYEEAKEMLLNLLYFNFVFLPRYYFWRTVPHRHQFSVRLVCNRCQRTGEELFR